METMLAFFSILFSLGARMVSCEGCTLGQASMLVIVAGP